MKANKSLMKNLIMKYLKSRKGISKSMNSKKNNKIQNEATINKYLKQKNVYQTKNQGKK